MTPDQQKALEALQALHAENERLGLYKDVYAQSMTTQTQVRSTEEALSVFDTLKLAIKAMKSFQEGTGGLYEGEFDEEIKTCEEALAQLEQEQEPVGEVVDALHDAFKCSFTKVLPVGTKLYTTSYVATPRPHHTWVGLTDEDMTECIVVTCNTDDGTADTRDLIRAVEAKLKEKNT